MRTVRLTWSISVLWLSTGPGSESWIMIMFHYIYLIQIKKTGELYKGILLSLFFYFIFMGFVQASSLEMRPVLLNAGGFKVDIFLSPTGEVLNAVEGKIIIPSSLRIREIRSGDSIVSFWLEKPEFKDGQIIFGGVIPGGFSGVLNPYKAEAEPGKLLEILFSDKPTNETEIYIEGGRVFLNDGLGTSKELARSSLKVSGSSLFGLPIKIEARDIASPEEFLPLVSRDVSLFNNKWFLSFAATDKQSGISAYYVYESDRREESIPEKKWEKAESPYLLHDQSLESFIFVRAVDGVGNEKVVVLEPTKLSSYPAWWRWIIIILLAFSISVLVFLHVNRRK